MICKELILMNDITKPKIEKSKPEYLLQVTFSFYQQDIAI